jgi:hypothetical protein
MTPGDHTHDGHHHDGHHHDGHHHDGHHHDGHAHDGHRHGVAVEAAPRGGPVVFDIGGDVGALVIYVDAELAGTEIPIEWTADPDKDVHTGVWPRRVGSERVVVAVYPELTEGRYVIPSIGGHPPREVVIEGGRVAEIDARSAVLVDS